MKFIDDLLDSITMYRLILYYLMVLLGVAIVYSFFGILAFNPISLIFSAIFLTAICFVTNKIFANVFHAPTNAESVYISALILALIISPIKSFSDLLFLFWAGVLTMASKYILAINKKHIFNPVAIAVVLTAFGFSGSASWWVGTIYMLPFSLLGLLIVRKIRRYDMVFYFLIASFVTMLGFSFVQGGNLLATIKQIMYSSPIFFFAFVMLTEPLTTPPKKSLQTMYGVLVGVLFAPQFHIGGFYTTPEISLVIGNIYSFIVSPKHKLILTIKEKIKVGFNMVDFLFVPTQKIAFSPGQYMEWTLPHEKIDARGNRRYFTIASSPTENELRLGVKFYPNGSSFKKNMLLLNENNPIVAGNPAGDFVLPKNTNQKLVFIAGGIGITPFRSMIKYLIDTKQPRPITLFYANKTVDEIVYSDIFNLAQREIGIKIVYTLTDQTKVPADWQGRVGRLDANMIAQIVPNFRQNLFYLSGPRAMVASYRQILRDMGVLEKKIKVDFFPGFA